MKKGVGLLLLLLSTAAWGQGPGPIETDRPDQSDGVSTLAPHYFQLETGLVYGQAGARYRWHSSMLRYGLLPKTELRLALDYGKAGTASGLQPLTFSFKQALMDQQGLRPAMTLIGQAGLPFTASPAFRPDHVLGGLTLAFEQALSGPFTLAYNLGAFLDGEGSALHWLVTTNLGYSPLQRLGFFLEYFATFNPLTGPDHNVDMGVLWLLQDNLQVDLAAGSSLFKKADRDRFVTLGISYRFGR